ncbi:restriction endonuclease subunit S [Vagococcus lutrae]|uniref:restriction endonuclease subunit S n=1 Tax=Vagococcus lutrae TaxID=81947 RepID=UPI001C95CAF2|nr:restriction endonuclease subunit S [Vagococcus lutrae]QZN88781.1 restriction endonuclease subunit S [Vagococcus lutrae]
MKQKAIKPVIRFEGFTDDWEQRKLGEIVGKIESGNRLPKEKIVQGNIPYIVAQSTNNGVFKYIDKNSKDYHGNNMKLFPGNSITFSIDNPHAIFYQEQPFYTSNIMRVIHKEELKREQYIFILESMKKFTHSYDWSRKFSGPVVSNLPLRFPSYKEEQVKIGTFFKQLDDTIALHQRQLEALEKTKKSFLQKMFPKKDETKPEIRFSGFTDDWEQQKLKNMLEKVIDNRGKTPPVDSKGEYPMLEVASLGGFYPDYSKVSKYVNKETFNMWFRSYLSEGDILFSTVGNTGLTSLMNDKLNAVIAQNIIGMRFKNGYNSFFMNQLFKNLDNIKKAKRIEMGAVQPSVKVSQLIYLNYYIPSYPEQQKIGMFLKQLDDTIALHQRQLEALEMTKKSFLQKMFI